jgi:hypothetical protein
MAKYIAADGTGSPFDLQRNFADVLIKLRMIKEYQPPKPKSVPASFGVGHYNDGKPFVVANCNTCNQKFMYEGENPQCMKVHHCKMTEHPPAEVVAEYLQARDQWTPKRQAPKYENRPTPEQVSSY